MGISPQPHRHYSDDLNVIKRLDDIKLLASLDDLKNFLLVLGRIFSNGNAFIAIANILTCEVESIIHNKMDEWMQIYAAQKLYKVDTVLHKLLESPNNPIFWSREIPNADHDFEKLAYQYKMHEGVSFGWRFGLKLLILSINTTEKDEFKIKSIQLLFPHIAMTAFHIIETNNGNKIALGARQKEILNWLCLGKSNWEIAQIIGKTERFVKRVVAELMEAYDVSNRAVLVTKVLSNS